jgi:hypothetical protein
MGRDELIELRRVSCIWRARGYGEQHVTEIRAVGNRKEFDGVENHVGFAAVRQLKLDRHAMRVREAGAIRDVGNARRVRETYRHEDRASGKQHRLTQTSGLRRGFEATRDNYSLGVISAKSRMNAIKLNS